MNNAAGLERTVKSVAEQSNKNFEYLVIDGLSNDGSQHVLEKYRSNITLAVSEKDTGIYNAMNKGVQNARGEYLLFLNSGDSLANERVIEEVLPLLAQSEVISGDIDIFDKGVWHAMSSDENITVDLFLRLSLYHQATFISKSLFEKYGLYDESFRSTGDYEFFIRCLLKNNASYHHIRTKISKFYADGMSNDPRFRDINLVERQRSWSLHFSKVVIDEMQQYFKVTRSPGLLWAKRIHKVFHLS